MQPIRRRNDQFPEYRVFAVRIGRAGAAGDGGDQPARVRADAVSVLAADAD